MTPTITAIQNEIDTALRKLDTANDSERRYLNGYIDGLKVAIEAMRKRVGELEY